MKTSDLIHAISADAGSAPKRFSPAFWTALAVAAAAAAIVFTVTLGPRHDFAAALGTVRYPLKFLLTGALALAAGVLVLRLARPGSRLGTARALIALAAGLVAASVVVELAVVPSDVWMTRLVGRNALLCLVNIPLLSALPLAVILLAARRGAPGSPAGLGAAAGLLAGAIGATFYAAHCGDDSPLFVAAWYSIGIGVTAAAGAAIGSRALRW